MCSNILLFNAAAPKPRGEQNGHHCLTSKDRLPQTLLEAWKVIQHNIDAIKQDSQFGRKDDEFGQQRDINCWTELHNALDLVLNRAGSIEEGWNEFAVQDLSDVNKQKIARSDLSPIETAWTCLANGIGLCAARLPITEEHEECVGYSQAASMLKTKGTLFSVSMDAGHIFLPIMSRLTQPTFRLSGYESFEV